MIIKWAWAGQKNHNHLFLFLAERSLIAIR